MTKPWEENGQNVSFPMSLITSRGHLGMSIRTKQEKALLIRRRAHFHILGLEKKKTEQPWRIIFRDFSTHDFKKKPIALSRIALALYQRCP